MNTFVERVGIVLFVAFLSLTAVSAQDAATPEFLVALNEDTPHTRACSFKSAGVETGTIKDLKFKTNDYQTELDRYCFYSDDPSIRFPVYIYVDRDAVVGDTVTLELLAYDIDSDYQGGSQNCKPEQPKVLLNGYDLGFLTGNNGIWDRWEVEVPKSKVKFLGESGEYYGENWVEVQRDSQKHPLYGSECWASDVDYGRFKMRVYPIIFIPGIAGTTLHNAQAGFLRFEESWPQFFESAISWGDDSQLDVLELEEDGVTPADPSVSIYPGKPIGLFYSDIKKFYRDKGILADDTFAHFEEEIPGAIRTITPVEHDNLRYFEYGYDWRLKLDFATAGLLFKVNELLRKTGMDKIVVYAHSMGGLVFQDFQRDDGDAVKMFLSLGTPYLGAGKAYGILHGVAGFGSPIHDDDKINELGSNFPGVYALLPSQKYFDSYGYLVDDHYDDGGASSQGKLTLTQTYLTDPQARLDNTGLVNWALAFFARQVGFPAGMEMYLVYGAKQTQRGNTITDSTIKQFKITKGFFGGVNFDILKGSGDGTVPLKSGFPTPQQLTGVDERKRVPYEHSEMVSRKDVIEYTWDKYTGVTKRDPALLFSGFGDSGVDINNNSLFDHLELQLNAAATTAGDYTIVGFLTDETGLFISSTSETSTLQTGSNALQLTFPGYHFADQGEENMTYRLTLQTFFDGIFQDEQPDLYQTQEYNATLFDVYPNISLEENMQILSFREVPLDEDNDNDIDTLAIIIQVNTSLQDLYELWGFLNITGAHPVALASNSTELLEGVNEVTLAFNGWDLAAVPLPTAYDLSLVIGDTFENVITNASVYRTLVYDPGNFSARPASFTGNQTDRGNDTDGNSLFETLDVSIGVDVKEAGTYTLLATLVTNETNKTGQTIDVALTTNFLPVGLHTIKISFDGVRINETGVSGQYFVRDVTLYAGDLVVDELVFAGVTNSYTPQQFESPFLIIGQVTNRGQDTNNNGLYDLLVVTMEVEAKTTQPYRAGLRLFNKNHTEITHTSDTRTGKKFNLTFSFNGSTIYSSHNNGPYLLRNLVVNYYNGFFVGGDTYLTQPYIYTQFEHEVIPPHTPKLAEPLTSKPFIRGVLLNSTYGANTTSENLTATLIDVLNSLTEVSDWRADGESIAVLNLPFDTKIKNGVVKDYSTFGNLGLLAGPTWVAGGKVGGSYGFDGVNDYVVVARAPSLNSTDNLTLEAWIYWAGEVNATDDLQNVITQGDFRRALRVTEPDHFVGGSQVLSFFSLGGSDIDLYSTARLSPATWYHLVTVYDGAALRIYINGQEDSSTPVSGTITPPTDDTFIGTEGTDYFFAGLIDEVHVYNRALSPEQIRLHYLSGLLGKHPLETAGRETRSNEAWQIAVTPNNATLDGRTVFSNTLTLM